MKKLSILMLGLLGMMSASCDDAPEAPKPQENPQEPIFAVGDITSATDGALASATVLDLESYREKSGIPVMKAPETKNLPEGAVVSYKVQLCAAQDFSGMIMRLRRHTTACRSMWCSTAVTTATTPTAIMLPQVR